VHVREMFMKAKARDITCDACWSSSKDQVICKSNIDIFSAINGSCQHLHQTKMKLMLSCTFRMISGDILYFCTCCNRNWWVHITHSPEFYSICVHCALLSNGNELEVDTHRLPTFLPKAFFQRCGRFVVPLESSGLPPHPRPGQLPLSKRR